MSPEQFTDITGRLEAPRLHEQAIILDGTKLTLQYVAEKLGLNIPA
jgi:hypothetical protein